MGLANWPYLNEIIAKRREIAIWYQEQLAFASLQLPPLDNREWNCAYYPVVFDLEDSCLRAKAALEANDIHPRRYFYPTLNLVNDWGLDNCPNSASTASRILCLPVFHDLTPASVSEIAETINVTPRGL